MNIQSNIKFSFISPSAFFTISAFILTLKLFYIFYVHPEEAYRGYSYINHGILFDLISYLLCLLPALFIPDNIRKPSDISLVILFVFIYIPSVSIGGYVISNPLDTFLFFCSLFIGIASLKIFSDFFTKYFSMRFTMNFPNQVDYKVFNLLILGLFGYSLFSLSQSWSGFFNIQTVAELYAQRVEDRSNQGSLSGYLYSIIKSLLLILAVYKLFVSKKNISVLLAASAILVVCLDLLMSQFIRSHLYIAFFLLAIGYFIKKNSFNLYHLPLMALFICFFSFFLDFMLKLDFFSHTFPRRLFVVPGIISGFYYNYISDVGTFYNVESASRLLDFSNVTYLIGTAVEPDQFEMNMSTSMWSISYAYFGGIGILLTSLISGIILSILNSDRKYSFFPSMIAIFIGLTWSEQSLWSSMLSSGIIFCLIYFYVYSNSNSINWKKL